MRREIQRGDFKAVLYDKSISVSYKGVWSGNFYLQRAPTEADVNYFHKLTKDLWLAGRESVKDQLRDLVK